MTGMDDLPNELLEEIAKRLDTRSLNRLAQTNRRLLQVARLPQLRQLINNLRRMHREARDLRAQMPDGPARLMRTFIPPQVEADIRTLNRELQATRQGIQAIRAQVARENLEQPEAYMIADRIRTAEAAARLAQHAMQDALQRLQ